MRLDLCRPDILPVSRDKTYRKMPVWHLELWNLGHDSEYLPESCAFQILVNKFESPLVGVRERMSNFEIIKYVAHVPTPVCIFGTRRQSLGEN